jgi:hypothetical protein
MRDICTASINILRMRRPYPLNPDAKRYPAILPYLSVCLDVLLNYLPCLLEKMPC